MRCSPMRQRLRRRPRRRRAPGHQRLPAPCQSTWFSGHTHRSDPAHTPQALDRGGERGWRCGEWRARSPPAMSPSFSARGSSCLCWMAASTWWTAVLRRRTPVVPRRVDGRRWRPRRAAGDASICTETRQGVPPLASIAAASPARCRACGGTPHPPFNRRCPPLTPAAPLAGAAGSHRPRRQRAVC